ncbi:methyl-accepting chemotaxis protein [Undibacterium pigrum]|uniref:Methyl-accepting chemotaxis protein n=1 Tax=Undibacterium pigrum TaxID=401470 RepID=A0A318JEQ1_9BURK|nr:methyl-accepting chemotaxis protein [Undibacterium pigrum]PXX47501.1 methyl-accepting chemotaxis protein [Undibacterium pigrum]
MNFANLKISQRLYLGFSVVIFLLVIVVAIAISRLTLLNSEINLTVNDRYQKIYVLNLAIKNLNLQARNLRNILLMSDQAEIKKEIDSIQKSSREITEEIDKLSTTIRHPKALELLKQVQEQRAQYLPGRDKMINLVNSGNKDQASELLFKEVRPRQLSYFEAMEALIKFQEELMAESARGTKETAESANQLMIVVGIFAAIISCFIAWSITRRIITPIHEAVKIAKTVAGGDLTSTFDTTGKDEMGSLFRALANMNENLLGIVAEVRNGTDTIATASAQIASGNQDLSARTEQQASALEETASSMEELTSTVKQNSDNALAANQLAQNASQVAIKGGDVVSRVVETMSSITDSSKKIVDIISVIDGIAFQTNILALNAAVEAARAGEQGRGFAVVATEVRNLAQRSATAAKEIKLLIDTSVEKVGIGSRLVDEAGLTMDEVVASVKRVTDIMSQISSASAEQTAGIEQINQAIVEMDNATQQNSALVEQVAAAEESMQDQAKKQADVVSIFKTGASALQATSKLLNIAAHARTIKKAMSPQKAPLQITANSKEN